MCVVIKAVTVNFLASFVYFRRIWGNRTVWKMLSSCSLSKTLFMWYFLFYLSRFWCKEFKYIHVATCHIKCVSNMVSYFQTTFPLHMSAKFPIINKVFSITRSMLLLWALNQNDVKIRSDPIAKRKLLFEVLHKYVQKFLSLLRDFGDIRQTSQKRKKRLNTYFSITKLYQRYRWAWSKNPDSNKVW